MGVTTSSRASIGLVALTAALVAAAVFVTLGPGVGASVAPHRAASTTTIVPTAVATTTTVAPTTSVAPTTTTAPAVPTADDSTMRPGDRSPEVAALQARLIELGFWLGDGDGGYGRLTEQAVLAFQKANELHRDGTAGPATLAALATASRPVPSAAVDGIEIDLTRQILTIVQGGQALWTINTSTGKASTRTPTGDFVVQREIDGIRDAPLGRLYRPKYFNGGIAIHGSPSIPGYPASHGCTRVSNQAMDFLWTSGLLEVGTPVRVH